MGMKFKEFELELQSLMDQRKIEQAESLLTSVDAEDLARCTQLIQAYKTMLGGLPLVEEPVLAIDAEDFSEGILAQLHSSQDQAANQASSNRGQRFAWFALATAASLLLIALPFSLPEFDSGNTAEKPNSNKIIISPDSNLAQDRQNLDSLPALNDDRFAGVIDSFATHIRTTEGASQLGYSQAEPWIEGVSTRLRPLTYSMGTAFTLIRSTADFPPSESEPSNSKPQAFWRMLIWEAFTV